MTKTKQQLEAEIEETRQHFHELLASIPDEAFERPSNNPAWCIGELLYHMSVAPRFMVADVQVILKRPFLLTLLPKLFPERLFHWLNARLTPPQPPIFGKRIWPSTQAHLANLAQLRRNRPAKKRSLPRLGSASGGRSDVTPTCLATLSVTLTHTQPIFNPSSQKISSKPSVQRDSSEFGKPQ